jgi:hypothetical protein
MSRSGESVTRLDIRFPNEMYSRLQQIAVEDGARTHHISQKVEVSPTVIKLVQLGLDALNGRLPDTSSGISDNLPDKLSNTLSDRKNNVSDISDKRIESIVDRRLTELGLFPDCQTENNSTSPSLPDKIDTVSDILPDRDVMISDRVTLLPDNLPDTENIPSDDSSNFESVAEVVQIIPTEAIEQASGEIPESLSWGDFHKMLDLPTTGNPSKAKGDIAIATAKEQGHGNWTMNSTTRKFTKQTENN